MILFNTLHYNIFKAYIELFKYLTNYFDIIKSYSVCLEASPFNGKQEQCLQVDPKKKRRHCPLIPITHQLVLIGRDGGEDGLREDEGAKLLRLEVEQRGGVVLLLDDVDPRLVLVHGVQDDLQEDKRGKNE